MTPSSRAEALKQLNQEPARLGVWGSPLLWLTFGACVASLIYPRVRPTPLCPPAVVPLSSGFIVISKTGEQLSNVLPAHEALTERDRWNKGFYHPNSALIPAETASVWVGLQHSRSTK